MNRGKRFLAILSHALILVLGFVFGFLLSEFNAITFDHSITSGNILQSAVTIGSAFLVALYLQKVVADERKQKELVLEQFEILLDLLGQLEGLEDSEELTKVNYVLKKVSLKNEFIGECMRKCHFPKEIVEIADFSTLIKELRINMTNTPDRRLHEFASTKNCPAYVREGIITWASERRNEIDVTIQKLKHQVFNVQIKINRV
jgi:hypothetical protein